MKRMSKELCWQVEYNKIKYVYYLKEFYTEKIREIPKRYLKQVYKLAKSKKRARVKLCNCEMELQEIIKKVLGEKKK